MTLLSILRQNGIVRKSDRTYYINNTPIGIEGEEEQLESYLKDSILHDTAMQTAYLNIILSCLSDLILVATDYKVAAETCKRLQGVFDAMA